MHPDIKAKLFNDIYWATCFGCGEMNTTAVNKQLPDNEKEEDVSEG